MATPAEVVAEERGRAEALADQFIALVQEAAAELYAAVVASPTIDVTFDAVQEPALEEASALRATLEARPAGGTGLDSTVETAIWDRARDRETKLALGNEAEIQRASEALGFSLPSGVIAAQLREAQRADHQRLFRRVSFTLAGLPAVARPTAASLADRQAYWPL